MHALKFTLYTTVALAAIADPLRVGQAEPNTTPQEEPHPSTNADSQARQISPEAKNKPISAPETKSAAPAVSHQSAVSGTAAVQISTTQAQLSSSSAANSNSHQAVPASDPQPGKPAPAGSPPSADATQVSSRGQAEPQTPAPDAGANPAEAQAPAPDAEGNSTQRSNSSPPATPPASPAKPAAIPQISAESPEATSPFTAIVDPVEAIAEKLRPTLPVTPSNLVVPSPSAPTTAPPPGIEAPSRSSNRASTQNPPAAVSPQVKPRNQEQPPAPSTRPAASPIRPNAAANVRRLSPPLSPITPRSRLGGQLSRGLGFPLARPTSVSSDFGWRTHPVHGDRRFHTGTDFAAPHGAPVVAAMAGRVRTAERRGGYGLAIELEHLDGEVKTLYAHLSELYVRAGEQVEQGQTIGAVGSTGNTTGPHLHFEVLRPTIQGWVAVNPMTQMAGEAQYAQGNQLPPVVVPISRTSGDMLASAVQSASASPRPIPEYTLTRVTDLKVSALPVGNLSPTAKPLLLTQSLAQRNPSGGVARSGDPDTNAESAPELPAQERFNNLDIDDFDYWADLCRTLLEADQFSDTVAACDRALAIDPDALEIWLLRGQALEGQTQYTEAIANYGYVLYREDRHSEALSYQCRSFGLLGNQESAIRSCDRALSVDRLWGEFSPAAAWHLRGQILARNDQFQDSLSAFSQSLRLQPEQSGVLISQGQAHFALKDYEAVLVDTEKALSINRNWGESSPTQALQLQGQTLLALELPGEAIAVYDQALANDLDNGDLWREQGQLLYEQKQYQEALTAYTEAVKLAPESSRALIGQAATLNELRQHEAALQAVEQALEGDSNWGDFSPAFIWDQRVQALGGMGQYDEALALANRAVGLEPDYAPAWNNRAVILWHLGAYKEALNSALRAIDADKTYAQAWFNRGRILSSMEKYEDSLAAYDQALRLESEDPANLWTNRGVVLWRLQRLEDALQSFEQALEIDGESYQARVNQGIILLSLGRHEEAIQVYDQATKINPEGAEAWIGKGTALLKLERDAEAEVAFTQASTAQNREATQAVNAAPPPKSPTSTIDL